MHKIDCILFDLDGTLLDTSYDFAYALNKTCKVFQQPRLNYQNIRKVVSQGGLAMIQLAFPNATDKEIDERKEYFLEVYFEHISLHTQLFPGLEKAMNLIAKNQTPWGIVTNKPTWLTEKLLQAIEFPSDPKTIVCGDTLAVNKPNREPLDLAAKECGIDNKHCLYLGDHPRDIEAGVNANMLTGAAMYGYLSDTDAAKNWHANYQFETPYEISQFLNTCFKEPLNN